MLGLRCPGEWDGRPTTEMVYLMVVGAACCPTGHAVPAEYACVLHLRSAAYLRQSCVLFVGHRHYGSDFRCLELMPLQQ